MLSYRHSFHAGNHADVLKHLVLVALLRHLRQKDKPFSYIDSHAGAGIYDLHSAQAGKLGEFRDGIGKLWNNPADNPLLQDYLQQIRQHNPDGQLRYYPGSPAIALGLMRDSDRASLIELHSSEFPLLKDNFRRDPRVALHQRDAFEGLLALAPPKPARGLALVDPAYEVKDDYTMAAATLAGLHRKWAVGVLSLWYPILDGDKDRSARLKRSLLEAQPDNLLAIELLVRPRQHESGMIGSGMLIINAPWQLDGQITAALNALAPQLSATDARGVQCEWLIERA